MTKPIFEPLKNYPAYSATESLSRSQSFYDLVKKRRTIRNFSKKKVPKKVIEQCILAAGTAPNGANKQPWHFVAVTNPGIKKKIKLMAEKEEREFYQSRASKKWLEDLEHLGTDENKPFLEHASHLIVVFSQMYGIDSQGKKFKNYYVSESVGIASGILITALHQAGLATLTHTPSPMNFLNKILKRPVNEKAMMIVVAGYPSKDAEVPLISKKPLKDIATFI